MKRWSLDARSQTPLDWSHLVNDFSQSRKANRRLKMLNQRGRRE